MIDEPLTIAKTLDEIEKEELYLKCHSDYELYAKTNLKIQTMKMELVSYEFNEIQTILEEIFNYVEEQGRPHRYCICKARREGVSTHVTGRFYWKTTTHPNHYTVIVTHEPEATDKLFGMQKRYYDNSQAEFKPTCKYNNAGRMTFNTRDGKGLDSEIVVGTAGKTNFGSSMLIHCCHLSEISKWPKKRQKSLLASILQAVPKEGDTWVVWESTVFNIQDEFEKRFWGCRYIIELYIDDDKNVRWREKINTNADKSDEYTRIFIPWFVFKAYRKPVPKNFKRTPKEEEMAKTYNLDDQQISFYRWVLPNDCSGDPNVRSQEYPTYEKEPFITAGTPAFYVEKVLQGKAIAEKIPVLLRYECLLTTGQWLARSDGQLLVWEEPRIGTPYLISSDISEGLPHGDFDSVTVWNHHTGQEAATYHGKMSPYDLGTFLYHLANRYNGAWIVPERNNHGISVIDRLHRDFMYKHLYAEKIEDPPHRPRKRFGWLTSRKSRPLIIDNLKEQVHKGYSGIKSPETFDEMLNFKKQDNGKEVADEGTFDDRVMDKAIGKYCLKQLHPVPVKKPESVQPPSDIVRRKGPVIKRRLNKKPNIKAFS